jgi:hypothetical protein
MPSFDAISGRRLALFALGLNCDSDELVRRESGNEGGVDHLSRFGVVFANRVGTAFSHEEFIVQYR